MAVLKPQTGIVQPDNEPKRVLCDGTVSMNICFIDQHRTFSTTFTPGFYTEIVRHAKVLIVFQMPWLQRAPEQEIPKQISENLWIVHRRVFAPYRGILASDTLAKLDTMLLDQQIKRYSKVLGWSPDIVECSSPHFRMHLNCRSGRKRVFWCVDHYSQVGGLTTSMTSRTAIAEQTAARNADLTLTTASELQTRFAPFAQQISFIPNAADHHHYQPLWMRPVPEPELLKQLPRPIFGFAGNVNPVSDWKFMGELAKRRPDYTFAIFGGKNGSEEFYASDAYAPIFALPNVHYLGRVTQEELPNYIAHFDAGLVIDPITEFSKTVNHNKMYQYLLSGIPVTGTNSQPDYLPFGDLIHLANNIEEWLVKCEAALSVRDETNSRRRRKFAEKMSWEANIQLRMKLYEALLAGKALPEYQFPTID